MRSGYVSGYYIKLMVSGANGYVWPSWANSDGDNAQSLYFDGDYVGSSNHYLRWGGVPLRCLVR